MSKRGLVIVFDLRLGTTDYETSFEKVIEFLFRHTFKNKSIKISSRALFCYSEFSDIAPNVYNLIDDAFETLIENDTNLDYLSRNYIVYYFQPGSDFMEHLNSAFPLEMEYLLNTK